MLFGIPLIIILSRMRVITHIHISVHIDIACSSAQASAAQLRLSLNRRFTAMDFWLGDENDFAFDVTKIWKPVCVAIFSNSADCMLGNL